MATNARPTARRGPSGAWNRLKPIPSDPLDAYGLPSKGETKLHDHKNQEAYYSKIVERYMKLCASTGGGDDLTAAFASLQLSNPSSDSSTITAANPKPTPQQPPSLPTPNPSIPSTASDLPQIFLSMRKLREGILASRRADPFAQRAYTFIIRASVLTRSWESYQPALRYLLHHVHPRTPLAAPEWQEFTGYLVLDLVCRQGELAEAYSVMRKFGVRDRRVKAALGAVVRDDWVRFWRVRRVVDGYQRAIMGFAVEGMRMHALKCLGRSYMNADRVYVERCGDATWEELVESGVGWQLQENGVVVIRKPKPK